MSRLGTFIRNFGYSLHTAGDEIHPGEVQKLLDKIAGTPEEAHDQPTDSAIHEAGQVCHRLYRAFRTGCYPLLPFYLPYPAVSGSADSPDYQGKPAGTAERRASGAL